jgi:hypothetical protein
VIEGRPLAGRLAWALVVALLVVSASTARAEPSDRTLVFVGAGLAVPDYFLGVTVHEGSHALAALTLGGHVRKLHLYPGRNPSTHHFQFGWTDVDRLPTSRASLVYFLAAPKISDALLLGGYTALYFTHALPSNRYGWLTLEVLATGFWVDFAKDVVVFHRFDDVVRIFDALGLHDEWHRLPARVLYLAIDIAAAIPVYLGLRDMFRADDAPTTMPLYALRW